MAQHDDAPALRQRFLVPNDHDHSDYFALIRELVLRRNSCPAGSAEQAAWQAEIDAAYALLRDEIASRATQPRSPVSFGTSGWRGYLGKDFFGRSVRQVTLAIVAMYRELEHDRTLAGTLGVSSLAEAQERGAVVGFDNRFAGEYFAQQVMAVLTSHGFRIRYAGEATTGVLSAAVLMEKAAFSVNLTPSHNPLEYAGFKYNAADAGPAASSITSRITALTRRIMAEGHDHTAPADPSLITRLDALGSWFALLARGEGRHGLNHQALMAELKSRSDYVLAVDCVHGASRVHIHRLLAGLPPERVLFFRDTADPTFGGVAPEPSTANMAAITAALQGRPEPLKLGAILDPDADRIRFTDGVNEIDMNMFGAMSYHFLHETKGRKGMVAKTVATSNFANAIAGALSEEVFEPRVGFKEFKPVIGKALVCFEESDGITTIGHTPEKDAYIGLILALDMVMSRNRNLGDYLASLQAEFGAYYPGRGGVTVNQQGEALAATLGRLARYEVGVRIKVGGQERTIAQVIAIDGRKMILDDRSWLMIRPSGTEPKVRFYVEARSAAERATLLAVAQEMLREIGLL
ncbi:MAG: phosphoglucomutase [Thermodesulfobacteriota bacterium]|jgi:phosphomannomutase